jgi:hypothetical protein
MRYYCSTCKQTISPAVYEYSTKHFSRPLCMSCQKSTETPTQPRPTYSSFQQQKNEEPDLEIDVLKGAQKVWKGVSRIVKERSIIGEGDLNSWIANWGRARRGLDFSMESKHFFLDGSNLDDFTKEIIKGAKNNILVANPYIEVCYLTKYLEEAHSNGIDIKIVHRPEYSNRKRVECQASLRKCGIILKPNDSIHSKK